MEFIKKFKERDLVKHINDNQKMIVQGYYKDSSINPGVLFGEDANYTETETPYVICEWVLRGKTHRHNFHQDDLELVSVK